MLCDGVQPQNIFGVDINSDFIEIGLNLFDGPASGATNSSTSGGLNVEEMKLLHREKLRQRFYVVNLLQMALQNQNESIQERKRFEKDLEKTGGVDVVYSGSVIHLFPFELTQKLVAAAYKILKESKNTLGMFIGRFRGSDDPIEPSNLVHTETGDLKFLHSAQSFETLLHKTGFEKAEVTYTFNDIDLDETKQPHRFHDDDKWKLASLMNTGVDTAKYSERVSVKKKNFIMFCAWLKK